MTKKISQLPAATSVDTNDEFVINQDGTTKKLTTANQWQFSNVNIDGGNIDGTAIGASSASSGAFTNLSYTGTLTGGTGVVNLGSGQVYKDASGNVGIGSSTQSWQAVSGSSAVQIGRSGVLHYTTNNAANVIGNNYYEDGANSFKYIGNGFASAYRQSDFSGAHVWLNAPSGTAGDPVTFQEAMRITSSGNVGIGTTAPSSKLHLFTENNNPYSSSATANQRELIIKNNSTTSGVCAGIVLDAQGSGLSGVATIHCVDAGSGLGHLTFGTRSGTIVERMRIDSSGNVLIGRTSAFTFVGDSSGVQIDPTGRLFLSRDSADSVFARQNTDGNILLFRRDTTTVGSISVTTSATTYNTSSDYRLKENIQPLTGALDKVQAMNPVTYDWKAGGQGEGFIAHELQEIAPYAVSGEKDGEDMQGVDYGKLTTLLVGAVQELTAKVKQLEAQLGA